MPPRKFPAASAERSKNMTLNELKSAVSALISQNVTERDPIFLGAANRSLEMLFRELPSQKLLTLPVTKTASSVIAEEIEHAGGEKISLACSGDAYSFKAVGRGSYTVRDKSGEITRDFDTPLSTIRGFIDGGAGEIVFEGDYRYTVFALTVFDGLVGKDIEDIPDTAGERIISADDYADDILSLSGEPRDASGRIVTGARVVGRSVVFPRDYSGLVTLSYERRPAPITESTVFIDAEPGADCVLTLLTAYLLTLEEDCDRAGEYLSLARDGIKELLSKRVRGASEYTDVTGWA